VHTFMSGADYFRELLPLIDSTNSTSERYDRYLSFRAVIDMTATLQVFAILFVI